MCHCTLLKLLGYDNVYIGSQYESGVCFPVTGLECEVAVIQKKKLTCQLLFVILFINVYYKNLYSKDCLKKHAHLSSINKISKLIFRPAATDHHQR